MALPKWLKVLEQIGPMILLATPLAPIAGAVIAGIQLAESLPGATGDQKRQIVQQIVAVAAAGANAQAGTPRLDPATASTVAGDVIDSIVGVTNLIHRLPETPVQ